ncbi:unnamed protein product [Vitrella brassicaformis CCMP3155]|uniref:Uncharacterized protein n=1 Tax=Vitrella brassicaformis (strain CCMP3155) TaxID=1169540 RepID=A0A0G4EAG7_VITBC|nr:unnamed protein product [Vitrella brassicaformis CCMP3155]|eukprot:CEL92951.1 unnamed protein product [Vitrella brassicaformis CCMP3155]
MLSRGCSSIAEERRPNPIPASPVAAATLANQDAATSWIVRQESAPVAQEGSVTPTPFSHHQNGAKCGLSETPYETVRVKSELFRSFLPADAPHEPEDDDVAPSDSPAPLSASPSSSLGSPESLVEATAMGGVYEIASHDRRDVMRWLLERFFLDYRRGVLCRLVTIEPHRRRGRRRRRWRRWFWPFASLPEADIVEEPYRDTHRPKTQLHGTTVHHHAQPKHSHSGLSRVLSFISSVQEACAHDKTHEREDTNVQPDIRVSMQPCEVFLSGSCDVLTFQVETKCFSVQMRQIDRLVTGSFHPPVVREAACCDDQLCVTIEANHTETPCTRLIMPSSCQHARFVLAVRTLALYTHMLASDAFGDPESPPNQSRTLSSLISSRAGTQTEMHVLMQQQQHNN